MAVLHLKKTKKDGPLVASKGALAGKGQLPAHEGELAGNGDLHAKTKGAQAKIGILLTAAGARTGIRASSFIIPFLYFNNL